MEENTNTPSLSKGTNLIKQFIINHYTPAIDYVGAKVRLSTVQLHQKVKAMFPDADITVSELHIYMQDQGFNEIEVRPFQMEWILDKKK